MSSKIEVEGWEQVVRNVSSYQKKLVDAIVDGAQLTQAQMVNHAKANHAKNAHSMGRFVSRHGQSGLVGSIGPGPIEVTNDSVTAEIVARQPYAKAVEEGTKKSKPYPYLEPARKAHKKPLLQNIKRFMKRVKP